jgi:hypothetical protein
MKTGEFLDRDCPDLRQETRLAAEPRVQAARKQEPVVIPFSVSKVRIEQSQPGNRPCLSRRKLPVGLGGCAHSRVSVQDVEFHYISSYRHHMFGARGRAPFKIHLV